MTTLLEDSAFQLGGRVTSRSYWFRNHTGKGETPLFRPTSVRRTVKGSMPGGRSRLPAPRTPPADQMRTKNTITEARGIVGSSAVVSHRHRVTITQHRGRSPVHHRASAPCRRDRYTAVVTAFIRCIGWREAEFAQQCA